MKVKFDKENFGVPRKATLMETWSDACKLWELDSNFYIEVPNEDCGCCCNCGLGEVVEVFDIKQEAMDYIETEIL